MTDPPDPFERLMRSHRRLEEACDALSIAAEDRDRVTAEDVCAFFERQVKRHEEDEELSLFPRLAALGPGFERGDLVTRLAVEHQEQAALAARLAELLADKSEDVWPRIATIVDPLVRGYRAHVEAEEQHLFPAARKALPPETLGEIAREMEERRGRGR